MVALNRADFLTTWEKAEAVRAAADMGCPFTIADGMVLVAEGETPPFESIWVDRDTLDPLDNLGEWEIVGGYSCDHGWIMHPSQDIEGILAADILATDGTYVTMVVDTEPVDWDNWDPIDTWVGWALLKLDN